MATFLIRSDHQRNSRYSQGGTVDVKGNKLGWWERTIFSQSPTDVTLVVTRKYARRPDLLAYDMYGKPGLMWVVMQYNNIIDVNVDFIEGTSIVLPTRARLFGELLTKSVKY